MDKCSFHGRLAELSIALSGLPALPTCSLRTKPLSSPEPQAHEAGTGSSCGHGRGQGPPPRRTA